MLATDDDFPDISPAQFHGGASAQVQQRCGHPGDARFIQVLGQGAGDHQTVFGNQGARFDSGRFILEILENFIEIVQSRHGFLPFGDRAERARESRIFFGDRSQMF